MSVERGRVAVREKEGVREREREGVREMGERSERGEINLPKQVFHYQTFFYHPIISFSRLLQFQFSFWNRKIERLNVVHFVNKHRSRL